LELEKYSGKKNNIIPGISFFPNFDDSINDKCGAILYCCQQSENPDET
jgi:hypothetical protein